MAHHEVIIESNIVNVKIRPSLPKLNPSISKYEELCNCKPTILIVDDIEFNLVPLQMMIENLRIPMPEDAQHDDVWNYDISI